MCLMSTPTRRHSAAEAVVASEPMSPLGSDFRVARRRQMADPEYAAAAAAIRPFEALARLVIAHRIENDLTQEQLAELMETSASAISRLESGQHQPNLETLRKFAEVSRRRLLVGFEDEVGNRELVGV